MKKKLLITILSLVCALTCAYGLAACGDNDDNGGNGTDRLSVVGNIYTFESVEISCSDEKLFKDLQEEAAALKNELTAQFYGATAEFKTEGVYIGVTGSTVYGTYEQSGATVTVTVDSIGTVYTVSGERIKTNISIPINENEYFIVTLIYKKGSGGGNTPVGPDDPDVPSVNPDDGTVLCKHEDGNLVHLTDGEVSTCTVAGWELDIYVCAGYDKDSEKGEVFCGRIFANLQAAANNNSIGRIKADELEEFDFSSYRRKLPLAPHTPVIDEAVEGTCVTKGKTEGSHCGVCNKVLKAQKETDYTDHSYTYTIKTEGATSSENSYTVCSECGRIENKDISFKMTLNKDGESYTLEKAGGTELTGEIALPYECNGKPVTIIGSFAFYHCVNLTDVSIPNSVISIGEDAFIGCTGLKSITISKGVTHIESEAFAHCSSIKSITIPNSVTSIGRSAFNRCSSLTSITIPNSVTSIGEAAFFGCSSLIDITIPNSVTSIGRDAFYKCNGLTIYCESEKQPIGWSADWCNYLYPVIWNCKNNDKDVQGRLPVMIDGIHYALSNDIAVIIGQSSNLTTVNIPATVIYSNITYNVKYIEDEAFAYCTSLMSITIPNSVTSIGKAAFYGCSSLTDITFGGTIALWNALTKDYNWNYNTGNYTIRCADGDIAKSNS